MDPLAFLWPRCNLGSSWTEIRPVAGFLFLFACVLGRSHVGSGRYASKCTKEQLCMQGPVSDLIHMFGFRIYFIFLHQGSCVSTRVCLLVAGLRKNFCTDGWWTTLTLGVELDIGMFLTFFNIQFLTLLLISQVMHEIDINLWYGSYRSLKFRVMIIKFVTGLGLIELKETIVPWPWFVLCQVPL